MFHAASIIFFDGDMHQTALEAYAELKKAWQEHYGRDVTAADLDFPPNTGPGAYSEQEIAWCLGVLDSYRRTGAGRLRSKRKAPAAGIKNSKENPATPDVLPRGSKTPRR